MEATAFPVALQPRGPGQNIRCSPGFDSFADLQLCVPVAQVMGQPVVGRYQGAALRYKFHHLVIHVSSLVNKDNPAMVRVFNHIVPE